MISKTRYCVSCFLLLGGFFLHELGAQTASYPALIIPSSPPADRKFVLGVTSFTDQGLSNSSKLFLASFPRMLAKNLRNLPQRYNSPRYLSEVEAYAKILDLYTKGAALAKAVDARDVHELEPHIEDTQRAQNLAGDQKAIAKAQSAIDKSENPPVPIAIIDFLTSTNQTVTPDLKEVMQVELHNGFNPEVLTTLDPLGPELTAQKEKVDLLIYGWAKEDHGYLSVTIKAYDKNTGNTAFTFDEYIQPRDPAVLAKEVAQRVEAWVAGREYGRLELQLDPVDAFVRVDGNLLNNTERVIYVYEEKNLVIDFASPGYRLDRERVKLQVGDRKHLVLKLENTIAGLATIQTTPPDATLYANGTQQKKGNPDIPLNGQRSIVDITADGFEPRSVILPAEGTSQITVVLHPDDGIGPANRIAKAKDDYYFTWGFFFITVPLAILSYAVWQQYNTAVDQSLAYSGRASGQLVTIRNTAGYTFGITLGLSIALGGIAIYQSTVYTDTAEK